MVNLEEADFAVLGDSIDLNQVPALPLNETVGYVKQAATIIVQHLNHFAQTADEKLRQMSANISRLETELTILEAKLASVPGLSSIKASEPNTPGGMPVPASAAHEVPASVPAEAMKPTPSPVPADTSSPATSATPVPDGVSSQPVAAAEETSQNVLTVQKDPIYAKYFRMVQVGVPAQAVKLKMAAEGLNPALLDTPNAPSPGGPAPSGGQDASDSGSESEEDE
ncbi:WASH complex subunit 3-like [Paramacrobiotus metropolitanus]|uniref:WASH complex subunit 3-like n=1 Tax=Paramacrobiotus metropolitanus TaxID=2943436 RepID=UPI002445F2F5|nr:WASH complex subunit 3-like [Paramacrobiotus metropolitanus]